MTTIGQVMTEYWIHAMRTMAATRYSLRADNSPVPPEIDRLQRAARSNFVDSCIGLSFNDFEFACDFAATTAATNSKETAVVKLVLHRANGRRFEEYMVFPARSIPVPPPYIKLATLTTYPGSAA